MTDRIDELEICEQETVHEDVLSKIREQMPSDGRLFATAELFKVFGDPTRAKIICALQKTELCVCDIAALLNMTSSAISHQLRILKQARIVTFRRSGKTVYYSLDDEHISSMFSTAFEHISEERGE